MNKKFLVTVDSFSFELDEGDLKGLDRKKITPEITILNHNGHNYRVEQGFEKSGQKKGSFWLKGHSYNFEIKNDLDQLVSKLGLSTSAKVLSKEVKSPMPGLVLEVLIHEGQQVNKGDQLLILEAMKMENVLVAEQDGVVESISCKKGEAVEKNQILLSFE